MTITIDPAEGVEPVRELASYSLFKSDVIIKCKKKAIEEARQDNPGLVFWTDGSKLDQGKLAAKWKEESIFLGENKEILDAELWAISEALDIEKKIANPRKTPVTILSDSPKALRAIALPFPSQENRGSKESCVSKDGRTSADWISHHFSMDFGSLRSHRE